MYSRSLVIIHLKLSFVLNYNQNVKLSEHLILSEIIDNYQDRYYRPMPIMGDVTPRDNKTNR